ncbi:MAG: type I methionyl aminopeptidase [Nitrospira sp.]|nr:type I methionyl aminopeptidase [Nitrospira sp.]MCB9709949.1 type I methionyl aminopeptidase [Nitrospiraceae bacterium]HQU29726.1 type I methionyl aminopeptidase [Nitrospirales bacterium]MCA9465379.1 type I methionyl aminopeptidase [Nitrospira sp.]MCA9474630.1 type I methionyl aminopeptidase [Nitrospira sp.]
MIILKTSDEIELIAQASRIVAECQKVLAGLVKPGISTLELDHVTEECIRDLGGIPAFKGYRNYPNSLCASVNEQVVHGIPSSRVLMDGDIIGLDIGAIVGGFYGDGAITISIGEIDSKKELLISVTKEALQKGVEKAVVGNRLSDISHAIQAHIEVHGFSVVRDFVGHGIGRQLHEEPQVPNYGKPGQGPRLKAGMALAIEPMVNMGKPGVKVLDDGWTAVTTDGSCSAHFEHTITIEPHGPARILTV